MRTDTHKFTGFVMFFLIFVAFALSLSAQTAPAQTTESNDASKSITASQSGNTQDQAYVIGASDMLSINVWKEPDVSRIVPVRSDGKISLPLIGEIQASGRTPLQLDQEIATKLKAYISEPEVTVMVQESKSQKFNILGLVAKPGAYPLVSSTTVLDAIALAGGFRDFAKKKSIYILRKDTLGQSQRIPFNYKNVVVGKNPQENIALQADDTIVVP